MGFLARDLNEAISQLESMKAQLQEVIKFMEGKGFKPKQQELIDENVF
jgi:hypothetical protein